MCFVKKYEQKYLETTIPSTWSRMTLETEGGPSRRARGQVSTVLASGLASVYLWVCVALHTCLARQNRTLGLVPVWLSRWHPWYLPEHRMPERERHLSSCSSWRKPAWSPGWDTPLTRVLLGMPFLTQILPSLLGQSTHLSMFVIYLMMCQVLFFQSSALMTPALRRSLVWSPACEWSSAESQHCDGACCHGTLLCAVLVFLECSDAHWEDSWLQIQVVGLRPLFYQRCDLE